MTETKKRRGPKPKENPMEPVQVRLTKQQIKALDKIAADRMTGVTRTQLIRDAVAMFIKSEAG